jgi:hypothetical protein
MKSNASRSIALCIAMSASMLTGCAHSIAPPPQPMARIPASALQPPAKIPAVRRLADGSLDGANALSGFYDLYDVAGRMRNDYIALQCRVLASQGQPLRADCPRVPAP